jgi:sporulation protein YlmC with PRC-barrel domain
MNDDPVKNNQPHVLSATSLIGDEVRTPEGEHLGAIKELVIDLETGQVAYAVLAVSAFLGLNEKLFALPWAAIAVDTEHRCVLLNVDKEWLRVAAGFDRHTWPLRADHRFIPALYERRHPLPSDDRDELISYAHENASKGTRHPHQTR